MYDNLHPHAEAVMAMNIWCDEYAAQRGGVMDFWNTLSASQRLQCAETVDRIRNLPRVMPDK